MHERYKNSTVLTSPLDREDKIKIVISVVVLVVSAILNSIPSICFRLRDCPNIEYFPEIDFPILGFDLIPCLIYMFVGLLVILLLPKNNKRKWFLFYIGLLVLVALLTYASIYIIYARGEIGWLFYNFFEILLLHVPIVLTGSGVGLGGKYIVNYLKKEKKDEEQTTTTKESQHK